MGRWFVQGHDVTAAAALRAVEDLRQPHQLAVLGFGPERSVVEAAVREAGWVRLPRVRVRRTVGHPHLHHRRPVW
jgi:hypothetical protein